MCQCWTAAAVDLTRLRNWFCSSLEDRPSEAWEDSDSNDLMRWAEECRAHTESLPTPISAQERAQHKSLSWLPACLSWIHSHLHNDTRVHTFLTHLQSLYSERPDCWAPWRSWAPAAGHWPRMAVGERRKEHELHSRIVSSVGHRADAEQTINNNQYS